MSQFKFQVKHFSLRYVFIFLIAIVCIQQSFAQTITTTTVSSASVCSYTSAVLNVTYTKTGLFTGGNIFKIELSDATGNFTATPNYIGSLTSTTNGNIAATVPAGTVSGNYLIRTVSTTPFIKGTTLALTITLPTGNPAVSGNGIWNAYAYGDNTYTNYYGFYTENNINLSSITRWDQNGSPSSADNSSGSPYTGCTVPADLHAVSYKRTNFSCDIYQIDVTGNDDAAVLLINGIQVWTRATASSATSANAWTGFLEPTSTVEFKWEENYGQSYGRINLFSNPSIPVLLPPSAGTNCTSFTANWTAFGNSNNYFIDVATDAAFTSILPAYNNLVTGNVTSKLITGLAAGTEYFYRVRAKNSTCNLTTGNSNVLSNQVMLSPTTPLTICQGENAMLTASNATNYTWTPSTGLSATNTAVVTASPTVTTTYTLTTTDAVGCSSSKSIVMNVNPTSGNPTVYGNGAWNAYAYNGYNYTTYYGTYTENNLSFNSQTRWDKSLSPSSADASSGIAYAGCPVPNDLHSVSYKRTGLPCGMYQIDITGHDDDGYLFIDGTQVWAHNGCCDTHTDVWMGFLSPSNTIEFKWQENAGYSYGSVNLNPTAVPIALPFTAGSNCTQFNANWTAVINTTNYFLDVATDAAFTSIVSGYNNLNVGNVTTYSLNGLTPGTIYYYRVRAYNSTCSLTTGNSNIITIQVQVSSSSVVICDGGSATLTASNASTYSWSPATGLSATTGASVVCSVTSNTVYTVIGTTAAGCTSVNTITVTADTIGNPNVYGNGFWNVYCYNNTFSTYRGMYTETNLSFNSQNRWNSSVSPSSANATGGTPYVGCPVSNDTHGVSYKRANFACGQYQIDVAGHDDDASLYIDGVQVWSAAGSTSATISNVWRGFLTSASKVEYRWQDNTGFSYSAVNITSVTTSPNAFTTSTAAVCQGASNVAYTVPAVNGATS
ncbi:MAG: C-terminal target protein, partial [Chitinophagaceae bacterium]|nr:C-terminal target protein [Chitinophagaceae bacterium]